MNKTFIICLILFFQIPLLAEEEAAEQPSANEPVVGTVVENVNKLKKPRSRIKSTTGVNSESSSFMGDPDNIDPLNPNRENLKEDEEPVLEDIRQIIDAPKKKKEIKKVPEQTQSALSPVETPPPTATVVTDLPQESQKESVTTDTRKKTEFRPLFADSPDLELEKKFNSIYRRYNINPTPADIWAIATTKQVLREYLVQKGDTLWSISKILFDDANFWPKIWAINKQGILNPHFIYPNSKIYFYMGNEESAPTLAIGEPSVLSSADESLSPAEQEDEDTIPETAGATDKAKALPDSKLESKTGDTAVADTKLETGQGTKTTKKLKFDRPKKIPPSLPISRSEIYFGPPKVTDIKIELSEFPRFNYEYKNDIYITDRPVKDDVQMKISETTKFRCYEGRIIRDIRYIGKLVDEYDIFEKLGNIKTKMGTMYAYRIYGKANPYQGKYLKIFNCKSLLTSDLVFVAKDKIQTFRNQKISTTQKAVLIGGPDVINQNLFAPNQIAYVDFGSHAYELGQEFKIMSQVTDEINGNIKIIEKYGSYAVVMLTDVNDIIAIGDSVILN